MVTTPSAAVRARRWIFGTLADETPVEAVTLANGSGAEATLIAYGASLQAMRQPDARGESADVILGPAAIEGYRARRMYFGSTVGRIANRVAGGACTIDGRAYRLPRNEGMNTLHGGFDGFDRRVWEIAETDEGDSASVTFALKSAHGDQGLPGALDARVTYRLDADDALTIEHSAASDQPTFVNLTNHSYWNLGGEGSAYGAMDHVLTITADHYLPVDAALIPTGERRAVDGTPFDFRGGAPIAVRLREAGDEQIIRGRGYDHCWIWPRTHPGKLRHMARLADPRSGRGFELWSNQSALQFYSGNYLDGTVSGKSGRLYRQGDAVVLEPQRAPDCVNQPQLGSARLDPGETYRNIIVYRFTGPR